MSPEQLEALFREQLAMLPPPAGIPPASANPKLHEAAEQLMRRIVEIMLRFGVVSPTIPPPPPPGPMASLDSRFTVIGQWDLVSPTITPPPPGPMASMDASDLNLRADTMEVA